MIYFIQQHNESLAVKIGYTASDEPEGRLRSLQTGNPSELTVLGTMPGTAADERELHRRFANFRLVGEWFRPVPQLLLFINQATSKKPLPEATKYPWPLTIYLAGKIGNRDWRTQILSPEDSAINHADNVDYPDLSKPWPVRNEAIFGVHHYAGPYFSDCRHIGSGDDSHQAGANCHDTVYCDGPCSSCRGIGQSDDGHDCGECGGTKVEQESMRCERADRLTYRCFDAIRRCDVLFAWIDSLDCYGTIVEIGYAVALGKSVWVEGPRRFRDMWFAYAVGGMPCYYSPHYRQFSHASPRNALQAYIAGHERTRAAFRKESTNG